MSRGCLFPLLRDFRKCNVGHSVDVVVPGLSLSSRFRSPYNVAETTWVSYEFFYFIDDLKILISVVLKSHLVVAVSALVLVTYLTHYRSYIRLIHL